MTIEAGVTGLSCLSRLRRFTAFSTDTGNAERTWDAKNYVLLECEMAWGGIGSAMKWPNNGVRDE